MQSPTPAIRLKPLVNYQQGPEIKPTVWTEEHDPPILTEAAIRGLFGINEIDYAKVEPEKITCIGFGKSAPLHRLQKTFIGSSAHLGENKRYAFIRSLQDMNNPVSQILLGQLVQILDSRTCVFDGKEFRGWVIVAVLGTNMIRSIESSNLAICLDDMWKLRLPPFYISQSCPQLIKKASVLNQFQIIQMLGNVQYQVVEVCDDMERCRFEIFKAKKWRCLTLLKEREHFITTSLTNDDLDEIQTERLQDELLNITRDFKIVSEVKLMDKNEPPYAYTVPPTPPPRKIPCIGGTKNILFGNEDNIPADYDHTCSGDGIVDFTRFSYGIFGGCDVPSCGICDRQIERQDSLCSFPCGHFFDTACLMRYCEARFNLIDACTACPTCSAAMGAMGKIVVGCRPHAIQMRVVNWLETGRCERCQVDRNIYITGPCQSRECHIESEDTRQNRWHYYKETQCPRIVNYYWALCSKDLQPIRMASEVVMIEEQERKLHAKQIAANPQRQTSIGQLLIPSDETFTEVEYSVTENESEYVHNSGDSISTC